MGLAGSRWRLVRTAAVAAVLLAVPSTWAAAAAGVGGADDPDGPCVLSWTPDSPPSSLPVTREEDPDLDVTGTDFRLTAKSLIATVHVRQLAEHPMTATGHTFNLGWFYSAPPGESVDDARVSYTQDVITGTRSNDDDGPLRTLRGSHVDFDIPRSQVVVTVPRHVLYAQMVHPQLEPTLTLPSVETSADDELDPSLSLEGDFTYTDEFELSFAACDRSRGIRPTTAQLDPSMDHVLHPKPCIMVETDPANDARHSYVDGGPASLDKQRQDLDVTQVRYHLTRHGIRVTADVPQLAHHPAGDWTQEFTVGLRSQSEDGIPNWSTTFSRSSDGTTSLTAKGPEASYSLDDVHGRVTVDLPRRMYFRVVGMYFTAQSAEQFEEITDAVSEPWNAQLSDCR